MGRAPSSVVCIEINKTRNKTTIPFIGEIPLVGSLFTNFSNNDEKREIILSITPYIVKKVEVPGTDIATIWSGGEEDLMARPKFGAFAQPLQSEVESTMPATAPGLGKRSRSAPFSALQRRVSAPADEEDEEAPSAPAPPAGPADGTVLPVAPSPAAQGAPVSPADQGNRLRSRRFLLSNRRPRVSQMNHQRSRCRQPTGRPEWFCPGRTKRRPGRIWPWSSRSAASTDCTARRCS